MEEILKHPFDCEIPPLASPTSSTSSAGRQLQFELYQAVKKNMVATRSSDIPAKANNEEGVEEHESLTSISRKRRSSQEYDGVSVDQPIPKRKRGRPRLKNSVGADAVITNGDPKEDGSDSAYINGHHDSVEENLVSSGHSLSPSSENKLNGHAHQNVMVVIPTRPKHNKDPVQELSPTSDENGQHSPASNTEKKGERSPKARPKLPGQPPNASSTPEDDISTTPPTDSLKATHKRFDSEEHSPPPLSQQQESSNQPETLPPNQASPANSSPSDNEDGDEDEAPETLTTSTGQIQALTKAHDEASAAANLKKDRKLKRKERDTQLKAQAKKLKKDHKPKKPPPASIEDEIHAENSIHQPSTSSRTISPTKPPLPDFLPAHILASSPPPFLPIPVTKPFATQQPKKPKHLHLNAKPLKDIKRNGVKIRVLEEGNKMLPPKADEKGRMIRENWLMGRGIERRPVGAAVGGFVRK